MSITKLSPSKQAKSKRLVYGFDIETYDKNRKMFCCSLYRQTERNNYQKVFFSKKDFLSELKSWRLYKNTSIVATNLSFDFFGTFFNQDLEGFFKLIWRGSDLLSATTYICPDGRWSSVMKKGSFKLEFIDTLNYARLSVKDIGKILGLPKLESPKALGRLPETEEERDELIMYNIRDSELSFKFMQFLDDSFYKLGATPKVTIASTSMSLFRNKYLKNTYYGHDVETLDKIFLSYYGGRTEVFARGYIKDYFYYDVNSLYPSVMLEEMPDPNTIKYKKHGTINDITRFEGFSYVKVNCPKMEYPLLPVRHDGKLIFPVGTFSGWYSHLELRKAIEEGYIIMDIGECIWYKKTCSPFREYVTDLYNLRKELKAKGDPIQVVVKLCMNSLYGKFAQSFRDREQLIHKDAFVPKDMEGKKIERIGDYYKVNTKEDKPAVFCFPEWSSYITAYARIKMHSLLKQSRAIYCDTDSIITKTQMPQSTELGKLKLECYIKEGFIIKPKFYIFKHEKGEFIKVKGVAKIDPITKEKVLNYPKISLNLIGHLAMKFSYHKFCKFREALRRNYLPNEVIPITKELDIEDSKRVWNGKFDPYNLCISSPIRLSEQTSNKQENTDEYEHSTDHQTATVKTKC